MWRQPPRLSRQREAQRNLPAQKSSPSAQSREKAATLSNWLAAGNIIISLAFFIFMYKYLPLLAATELKKIDPASRRTRSFSTWSMAPSAWYCSCSSSGEFRSGRIFAASTSTTAPSTKRFSPSKTATRSIPRPCRNIRPSIRAAAPAFLMTVMLISIGFYMLIPFTTFWARFASRIALLPVIAGVSYEIIRFAAKHRGSLFA